MEKKHRCKLCFRNFVNGRALGGHMRSHMMKFYEEQDDDFRSYSSPSSSSSEEEEEENSKECALKMVDHDYSSVVVQDRESETESFRRSKRIRKSSSLSSISDSTSEEHVAQCLIMLSRDKWEKDVIEYEEEKVKGSKVKVKGKYRCEACNKMFKTYQALGGHRASHKKIKVNTVAPPRIGNSGRVVEEKVHKCPFCDRIFSSGQALGGHKRSHFIGANFGTTGAIKRNSRIDEGLKIDLNLPAPIDEDEISQIEISAVSDGEFVHKI